ncbi:Serine/threonine-protein phosphatase 2A activator 1 [Sporothrix stenoceras]|uniref:Serine/threonine-protein phosphatase 2A activator n=1 Tax=Sporothrix stenoceras TaxID=5173 RepID=A0ABR3Z3B2_9PEZI
MAYSAPGAPDEPAQAQAPNTAPTTASTTAPSTILPPPPRPASSSTTPTPPLPSVPKLEILPGGDKPSHTFLRPSKCINEGPDVARFLVSKAYRDIGLFVLQLNHALCPRRKLSSGPSTDNERPTASTTTLFTLQSPKRSDDPPSVQKLQALLTRIAAIIEEAPPDPGPRRFGNASFRTWHKLLAERIEGGLLEEYIAIKGHASANKTEGGNGDDAPAQAMDEVKAYFLGGFGSAQRLDYGTGHELSFLAFLGCLWKLGVFADGDPGTDGEAVERSLVLGVLEPYLHVVRRLILTYTLEPAGSHGVWGLDDHSFLPYIFGSAQLTRPIAFLGNESMPQEGSAPRVPKPSDIVKPDVVATQRECNLYFSAVGFINDVKKGPFWEHSPILFDVSGIQDGWGKINKGMIKMFNAEVLSKLPVVQHFVFGSLFSWDEDPAAAAPVATMHMTNQPVATAHISASLNKGPGRAGAVPPSSALPPTGMPGSGGVQTATGAPWAQATRMPGAAPGALPGPGIPYSRVPMGTARPGAGGPGIGSRAPPTAFPRLTQESQLPGAAGGSGAGQDTVVTKAPWAK